ncbi:MAG: hypothetical protein JNM63_20205, partial [Spirochaetia bacterium]|nr:hypothetical protein [Spirochaetia bacterium]
NDAKTIDKDYVDLMNPASVASNFSQPVQVESKALGSYNGFTCGFFAQIKIKAVIPIPGGSNLYTKPGNYSSSGSQVVATSSLKNSPAEESVIQLASAGTWFRLLKPFVITQKDIDNKTNFNLLIAFNPDKLLQGLADATGAQSGPLLVDGTNSITMGLFNLTAVPYRQGEVVVRETYTAHYVSSPNDNQVRLEIYTIKSDSGNIYAATEQEYADPTALLAPQGIFPFNSAAESGGKISLIAASGTAIVSNFTRQTSVGGSTAAYYKGVSTTFTLKEIKEVN